MSDSDFFSFDKALDKLSLEEEDLKRLISAGEIRAFRDGSKMRLRVEDVDRVAGDLGLGGGEEELGEVLEVEEVLFEEDAGQADQGMVTTQLSEEDTLLDDGVEEVEMEEVSAATATPAAVAATTRGAGRGRAKPEEVEAVESGGMRFALITTTIVMVYGLAFLFAMHEAQSSGITNGVVKMFVE